MAHARDLDRAAAMPTAAILAGLNEPAAAMPTGLDETSLQSALKSATAASEIMFVRHVRVLGRKRYLEGVHEDLVRRAHDEEMHAHRLSACLRYFVDRHSSTLRLDAETLRYIREVVRRERRTFPPGVSASSASSLQTPWTQEPDLDRILNKWHDRSSTSWYVGNHDRVVWQDETAYVREEREVADFDRLRTSPFRAYTSFAMVSGDVLDTTAPSNVNDAHV